MKFCIVTPCFNAETFIDETIYSVLAQAGPFRIRYHVQDGGSTDRTLEKLERWRKMLADGLPILCEGFEFTFSSEKDNGIYDAVNRGFAACGEGDALTWINADDRLQQGALVIVSTLFGKFKNIQWMTGSSSVLAETGFDKGYMGRRLYPRRAIQAGIYDERHYPRTFIQQEGTFWTQKLWQKVGGLNGKLRLAGDFDLWRRFAKYAEMIVVDRALGSFRMREGQASKNRDAYYEELDSLLSEQEKGHRNQVSAEFQSCRLETDWVAGQFQTTVAWYNLHKEAWELVRVSGIKFNFV